MNALTLSGSKAERLRKTTLAAAAYALFTVSTAAYPTQIQELTGNVSAGLLYTTIGLSNEVGELAELFDQAAINPMNRTEQYQKAWKELGDVQWYAARTCAENPELESFESLVERAMVEVRDDPRELRLSGFDLQSGLCIHAGRVLGVVKKMMRDGSTWDADKRLAKLAELQEALYRVVVLSVDFAENTGPLVGCVGGYVNLLRANSDKLSDRKDRGVLKGDGDNR